MTGKWMVLKYPVGEGIGTFDLVLPNSARFMHLEAINNEVWMWCLADVEQMEATDMALHQFYVITAGPPALFVEPENYLGTYVLDGGGFVGHVFSLKKFNRLGVFRL